MRCSLAAALLASALTTAAAAAPRPVRVQTVSFTVQRDTMAYSGTVQARHLAELGFRVGGKVVERLVEVGDEVRVGQVLARLDPSDLQLSLQNAANALREAAANEEQARADLRRYVALGRSSPSYLPSEYDRRLAASRSADARLAQAAQSLGLARNQADYATLRADADGVITALPVEIGQVVTSGQTVAALAHSGETEIWVDVPENRLTAIRGAAVEVTPWTRPDKHFAGRVREVGALADAATRTYTVKVSVPPDAAAGLSLGMTATVAFPLPGAGRTAELPASALTDRDGRPAVWVLGADGHADLRPVSIDRYEGDGLVAVSGGLTAGERVITAGADLIDPDMPLTAWAGPTR